MMNIIIMYSNFVLEYRNSKTSLILKRIFFLPGKFSFFILKREVLRHVPTYVQLVLGGWWMGFFFASGRGVVALSQT
jgi:hypothetical protein